MTDKPPRQPKDPISPRPTIGANGLLNASEWRLVRQSLRLTPTQIADALNKIELRPAGDRLTPSIVKSWERGASHGPPKYAVDFIMNAFRATRILTADVKARSFVSLGRVVLPERQGDNARKNFEATVVSGYEFLFPYLDEEAVKNLQISAWDHAFIALQAG